MVETSPACKRHFWEPTRRTLDGTFEESWGAQWGLEHPALKALANRVCADCLLLLVNGGSTSLFIHQSSRFFHQIERRRNFFVP